MKLNKYNVLILIVAVLTLSGCDDGPTDFRLFPDASVVAVVGGLEITDTSTSDPPGSIARTEWTITDLTGAFVDSKIIDFTRVDQSTRFFVPLPPDTYALEQLVVAVDQKTIRSAHYRGTVTE